MRFIDDPDFTLYVGDVREQLVGLPDESVHCVVTSPPYWGLRDYGTGEWAGGDPDCDHAAGSDHRNIGFNERWRRPTGELQQEKAREFQYRDVCAKCGARRVDQQLGLEPTPDLYVANMVAVFREVWRVLRRDGTCWVNLGDSYNSIGGTVGGGKNVEDRKATLRGWQAGLKPKDLVGIPWRVAFALQADGWYLRSDIVWSKPNPMPESVTDRPTKAHEYLFLLTRSPRYYFDAEAVREPYRGPDDPSAFHFRYGHKQSGDSDPYMKGGRGPDGRRKTSVQGADGSLQHRDGERWPNPTGRNVRSVWEIATQPYPEAHFATFPEELPRRCISAGTSERGCCPECGAPWEREVARGVGPREVAPSEIDRYGTGEAGVHRKIGGQYQKWLEENPVTTVGWRPSCRCVGGRQHGPQGLGEVVAERVGKGRAVDTAAEPGPLVTPPEKPAHAPVPCTVLDPFMGSGTTALVARKLGRRSIGVELNREYAELAARRLSQLSLFGEAYPPTPVATGPRPRGLTGGAYSPPGQSPHSNARPKKDVS